ncbi:MAG TPA: hypothetical protein VFQ85_06535, partial [Mycobacteriales bacterium]|nr:hypothetical protein [Mycobacteriales bacterium]
RLDRLPAGGVTDLVRTFLHPLWLDLVQSWLGLPLRPLLALDPEVRTVAAALPRDAGDDAEAAAARLLAMLDEAAEPGTGHGLLGTWATSPEVGVRLLNLYADAAPAVTGAGLCLGALLRRPDAGRIAADPVAVAAFVRATLRDDPPQVLVPRVAVEPLRIGGHEVAVGDRVAVVVGAANAGGGRDTASLTFGAGPHACLGHRLAHDLAVTTLRELVARFPDAELAGDPEWLDLPGFRCQAALPVRLR